MKDISLPDKLVFEVKENASIEQKIVLEYFRESLENAYSDARRSILGGLLVCFADERMFEERMKSLGITGVSPAKITEDFCDIFIKCFENGLKNEVVNIVIDCNKEQNARLDGFWVIDARYNSRNSQFKGPQGGNLSS